MFKMIILYFQFIILIGQRFKLIFLHFKLIIVLISEIEMELLI